MIYLDGIVGISPDLEVSTGYDDAVHEASARNRIPEGYESLEFMSKEQKQALADKMIALWTAYKDQAV